MALDSKKNIASLEGDQVVREIQHAKLLCRGKTRSILFLCLRVVLSSGILALLLVSIDLGELYQLLEGVRVNILYFILLLIVIERILNTLKWQIMLQAQGIYMGLWPLFRIQMTSGCLGSFLPTVGVDVLRMLAVSKCTNKPLQAVSSSILDRGLTVGITLVVAAITGLIAGGRYIPWIFSLLSVVLCLIFLLVGFILTRTLLRELFAPLLIKLLPSSFFDKLQSFFKTFILFRYHPGILAAASLLTVIILLMRIIIVYLEAIALNIQVEFLLLCLVLPLVWVILMIPISIGGIGLQEGAFYVALTGIGVSGSGAVSISILEHIVIRIVNLPGLYMYLRGGLVGGKLKKDQYI